MRGGLRPALLSDAGWWQSLLAQYAVFAVAVCSRAATERLAVAGALHCDPRTAGNTATTVQQVLALVLQGRAPMPLHARTRAPRRRGPP
jgi:hypothetical protein